MKRYNEMRDAYKDERVNVRESAEPMPEPWYVDPEPMDCCNEGHKDGLSINKPLYPNEYKRRN